MWWMSPSCAIFTIRQLCEEVRCRLPFSTGGESPALAQRLRKKLEKQFGPEYAEWVKYLGESRRKLNASSENAMEKKSKLHSMVSESSFRTFQKGRQKKAKR